MFKKFKSRLKLDWQKLESNSALEEILTLKGTVAIFKHSTRCPISSMAKSRIESKWESTLPDTPIYYLDLIKYRGLSNLIEEKLSINHQSPQLILLKDGNPIYSASHSSISASEIAKHI